MHNSYRKGVYDLTGKGIPLGVNGLMPELARLIADNKASIIANTGTLVAPMTKDEFVNKTVLRPLFLFAHNHQARAVQTGIADNLSGVGWAGRIADDWGNVNGNSAFGLNYTYGNSRMQMGRATSPQALSTGTPEKYAGMDINKAEDVDRRGLFKALYSVGSGDKFKSNYNRALGGSMDTIDSVAGNWPAISSFSDVTDSYGNPLFTAPDMAATGLDKEIGSGLIKQLESVAEMIRIGRDVLGLKRQFFRVSMGGFDHHASQIDKHPTQLRELSIALYQFQLAMESMGAANQVVSFTVSEFGRSATANGSGTDHAWGSQQLVIGGDGSLDSALTGGGTMIGKLPDLTSGGLDDVAKKGRMIPTIATDQYAGTIMRWFGVDKELMPAIFPNLKNFGTLDEIGAPNGSAYLPLV